MDEFEKIMQQLDPIDATRCFIMENTNKGVNQVDAFFKKRYINAYLTLVIHHEEVQKVI